METWGRFSHPPTSQFLVAVVYPFQTSTNAELVPPTGTHPQTAPTTVRQRRCAPARHQRRRQPPSAHARGGGGGSVSSESQHPQNPPKITGKSVVLADSAAGSGHSEPGPCPNRIIRKAPESLSSDASKEPPRENSILGPWPGAGALVRGLVVPGRQQEVTMTAAFLDSGGQKIEPNAHASSNSDLKAGVIPILLGNFTQFSVQGWHPVLAQGRGRARAQPGL
eukprot:gene10507-biopygen13851